MEFIPSPLNQHSFLKKHPYYWQIDDEREEVFHLYHNNKKVASLSLQDETNTLPYIQIDQKIFEIQDNSTFFALCLLLIEKNSGICAGRIEKNDCSPNGGTIRFQGNIYGWKYNTRPDANLLLMDEKRKRLFSYHYCPRYVRLLLNRSGLNNQQLIPLLCIGSYLLPLWQRSHSSYNIYCNNKSN